MFNTSRAIKDWCTFAAIFDTSEDMAVCERCTNLLKYFHSDDLKNCVESGTAEQYVRLKVLLADVESLFCDAEEHLNAKKHAREVNKDELQMLSKFIIS